MNSFGFRSSGQKWIRPAICWSLNRQNLKEIVRRPNGIERRVRGAVSSLVANLALARKLAEMSWRLMVHGWAYVEAGLKKHEAKVAQTKQRLLQKLVAKYNLVLPPKAA